MLQLRTHKILRSKNSLPYSYTFHLHSRWRRRSPIEKTVPTGESADDHQSRRPYRQTSWLTNTNLKHRSDRRADWRTPIEKTVPTGEPADEHQLRRPYGYTNRLEIVADKGRWITAQYAVNGALSETENIIMIIVIIVFIFHLLFCFLL